MAYERTNWQNGDVISSEKLNKMEAGIEYACSLEHEVEDPTEGQVLKYDAEKGKFVNEDVAIETNIQNPTDGQTLKYDAESGKWVNGEGGSSKLTVTFTENTTTEGYDGDKTWQEVRDAFPNVELLIRSSGGGSYAQNVNFVAYDPSLNQLKPYVVNFYSTNIYNASPNDYLSF